MGEEFDINTLKKRMNGGGRKDEAKQQEKGRNSFSYRERSSSHYGRNTQHSGKKGGETPGKGAAETVEVTAPYNFISFSDKVYQYPEGKLTAHNEIREELFTGELCYRITAKTPIFVDGGNQEFYRNSDGKYAIPGSTMRGLIRNNVQILGLSSFWDDIDDYALMYRHVAAGMEKKRYNDVLGNAPVSLNAGAKTKNISILKNVKAGYIRNEGGKYVIYRTNIDKIDGSFGEMNYYPLSERRIIEEYLALSDKGKFAYDFFDPEKNILQNNFKEFIEKQKNGRTQYEGEENKGYRPYMLPVSYEVKNLRHIVAVGKPGKYSREGYVVSSGKMRQKKILYIIPAMDGTKKPIPVSEKDVNAFRIDYQKRENKLADKDANGRSGFFNLPMPGETKPVFYIYLDGRLYFGFTPRLRLFYDHTIKQGLNAGHQEGILDYSRAMFGYSDEKTKSSYKTKLSFSDAAIVEAGDGVLCGSSKAILGEPNPTSYLEYVKPKEGGRPDTYNSKDFQLRGVKQYWLHKDIAPHMVEENQKKVASDLNPLKEGVHFEGKVRFQNLTMDELGLLLWSIQLKEGSKMNVGKAKSYGYGQIQVEILKARRLDLREAYRADTLVLEPFRPIDIPEAIQAYKDAINQFLGSANIDQMPHIKEFFAMKDGTAIQDNKKTGYMDLEGYKKQLKAGKVLPSISETIKK